MKPIDKSLGSKIFQIVVSLILIILALCAVMPFVMLISSSFSSESVLLKEGYGFWPKGFTLYAYEYLIKVSSTGILKALGMSIFITVIGVALHLIVAPMFAYPLSRRDYPRSRIVTFLCFFTMMFSGGTLGSYIIWTSIFHVKNTIFALILPNLLFNPFTIILYKNSFANDIHPALIEAAKIDGASEFYIYLKIVLPLSKPILAAMGLMTGIAYWNDWVNGQYYITDKNLYTLQVMLNKIIDNLQAILQYGGVGSASAADLPNISIRMAIAVVGAIPILILYPFFQKAFVAGISLGGVKE